MLLNLILLDQVIFTRTFFLIVCAIDHLVGVLLLLKIVLLDRVPFFDLE